MAKITAATATIAATETIAVTETTVATATIAAIETTVATATIAATETTVATATIAATATIETKTVVPRPPMTAVPHADLVQVTKITGMMKTTIGYSAFEWAEFSALGFSSVY